MEQIRNNSYDQGERWGRALVSDLRNKGLADTLADELRGRENMLNFGTCADTSLYWYRLGVVAAIRDALQPAIQAGTRVNFVWGFGLDGEQVPRQGTVEFTRNDGKLFIVGDDQQRFIVEPENVTVCDEQIAYRLYEEKDGALYPLQHKTGTPVSIGTWMEADVKLARDGSGNRWYKAGFHATLCASDVIAYREHFRPARRERLRVVKVTIRDCWHKAHSPAPIMLARYMRVEGTVDIEGMV